MAKKARNAYERKTTANQSRGKIVPTLPEKSNLQMEAMFRMLPESFEPSRTREFLITKHHKKLGFYTEKSVIRLDIEKRKERQYLRGTIYEIYERIGKEYESNPSRFQFFRPINFNKFNS